MLYILHRNTPPHIATIDLQLLVEEDQKRMLGLLGEGTNVTDQQRHMVEKLSVDFAKKLSLSVSNLEKECHCIILNKAAILGGKSIDYTDLIRERMKP